MGRRRDRQHNQRPGTLRYLWSRPYGRLALLAILVGALGLTVHYWTAVPLLLTLPDTRGRRLW